MVWRWTGGFGIACGLLALPACSSEVFECVGSHQCGEDGACEENGYCSFPSSDCPSGRKYGDLSNSGVSGQCVPEADGTSSEGGTAGDSGTAVTSGDQGSSSTQTPVTSSVGGTATGGESSTSVDTTTTSDGSSSTTTIVDDGSSGTTTAGVDPCRGFNCDNGGVCVSGVVATCNCDGTGYGGASCSDDVDECARRETACSAYATCTNQVGSFLCECGQSAQGDPYAPDGCCPEQDAYACVADGAIDECEPTSTDIDELVFDAATGLEWSRLPEDGEFTWADAQTVCTDKGMRVPTRIELEGVVDILYSPTWMPCVFERGVTDSFWTSTTVGGMSAFIVHFSFGGTGNDVQGNSYGVRCVQ